MKNIHPDFKLARRRAQRFEHPHLNYPAYMRKTLKPRVQIGVLRDPAAPIEITPAIHTPPEKPRAVTLYDVMGALSICLLVSLFFVEV